VRSALFVDDERPVLEALRDALRPFRREWRVAFAASGDEALARLSREPFDVVVSDLRMPGMDGPTLLARVQQEHPNSVRIALSGYAEMTQALKASSVAHVFLAKPCAAEHLQSALDRAVSLQAMLRDERLRRVAGAASRLPSVPLVYAQLVEALGDPETGTADVAAIVEQDAAMTAKLLQLVNSAFFGLPRRVERVSEAVSYLGLSILKALVLSEGAFSAFDERVVGRVFSIERLQAHATLVAQIALKLAPDSSSHATLLTAGLLHDIGKLIAATSDDSFRIQALEMHAELGAYLLGEWGLPHEIVEAVAYHHTPGRLDARFGMIPTLVHVADALAHEAAPPPDQPAPGLDEQHLSECDLLERLPGWRALARELV
jgi:putative nucleotidyltransferase with HDIG domain